MIEKQYKKLLIDTIQIEGNEDRLAFVSVIIPFDSPTIQVIQTSQF